MDVSQIPPDDIAKCDSCGEVRTGSWYTYFGTGGRERTFTCLTCQSETPKTQVVMD